MSSPQDRVSKYFRSIHFSFTRLYSNFLTAAGLTLPQYALLYLIDQHDEILMREASEHLYITKPAVTYLADQLEGKGLLKRMAQPKDRRVFLLKIQPKGKKIVAGAQEIALRLFLKSLNTFSKEHQKVVADFYQGISENLELSVKKSETKHAG